MPKKRYNLMYTITILFSTVCTCVYTYVTTSVVWKNQELVFQDIKP